MSQRPSEDQGWSVVGEKKQKEKVQLIRNSYTVIVADSFEPHYASSEASAQQKSIARGGDFAARGSKNTVLQSSPASIIAIIGGQSRDNIVEGASSSFTLDLNVSRWVVNMRVSGSDASYAVSSVDNGIADVTIKGYIEPAGSDPLRKLRVTGIAW